MELKSRLPLAVVDAKDVFTPRDDGPADIPGDFASTGPTADLYDSMKPPAIPTSVEPLVDAAPQWAVTAAQTGDVETLRTYLGTGGSANALDAAGTMPLHSWAAVRGQAEAFSFLGDNGANLWQRSPHSHALSVHMAAQSENVDGSIAVLKYILDKEPKMLEQQWVGLNWHTPLLEAAYNKQAKKVEFLASRGGDLSACGIRNRNANGWVDDSPAGQALKAVLDKRHAPAPDSPESKAYLQKLVATIQPPVLRGEALKQSQLAMGVQTAMTDIVSATTPEARQTGWSTLRDLVEKQHANLNTLGGLLQQPALVYLVSITGSAPDVEAQRIAVLKYLLANRADPTVREKYPMNSHALFRANVFEKFEYVRLLIMATPTDKRTVFVNSQGIANGFTALHDAIIRATPTNPDSLGLVSFLRQNGALSNHENYAGATEAQLADRTNSPEVKAVFNATVSPAT